MGLATPKDGWTLSVDLWAQFEALIPKVPTNHPLGTHRQRLPSRRVMEAILFVLRTGSQWKALNATGICSSSTAHRRFQEWRAPPESFRLS